jgi:uncharacterized membrane protein
MNSLHLVLRVVHVLLAAFWAGSVFLMAIFLVPAVEEAGPAGGTVMQALTRRRMPRILIWTGVLTILTGLYLLWQLSHHFTASFMGSSSGILLSVGALLGIIALFVGVHMSKPAVDKLGALGAKVAGSGAPPTPEDLAQMERLRGRLKLATRLMAAMLAIALVCMALGPHI